MYLGSFSFLTLSLLVTANAQRFDQLFDSSIVLREEFLGFEEEAIDIKESDQHFLRRSLQSNVCRALNPLNVPLPQDGANFCNELSNYACQCTGSAETSCSYCMIRVDASARGIRCQVSGSLVTFMDGTNTVTTCGCEYLGNGQVHQYCYQDSGPVPIPAPAIVIAPPPAPVAVRAPIASTVAAPVISAAGSSSSGGKGKGNSKSRRLNKKQVKENHTEDD